jgi:phosphoribosylanthranilate isomerase
MSDESVLIGVLQKRAKKLEDRRQFFRKTSGVAVGMAGGVILSACGGGGGDANAQANGPTDAEILNFALNLEYLESQFYHYAVFGTGLPANLQSGVGTQGAITGGRAVAFKDPVVAQYAKEIAQDEIAHVAFLRAARIPLGPDAAHFDLVEYAQHYSKAQAILLDAHVDGYGGGGKAFNWSLLPPNVASHLVLSGGLTPANVTDGILQVRPRGLSLAVDVSSGVEADGPDGKPLRGIKDAGKIHRFIAAVRAADDQLLQTSHVRIPVP